ncbi:MAG: CBS domain-containing protein [Halorhabdus sp.]
MNDNATVGDVMSREFVGVSETDSLRSAVQVMADEGVENAVVLRGREPVGVVAALDVLALAAADGIDETDVVSAMSDPPPRLGPSRGLDAAVEALSDVEVPLVLVTEGDDLLGTVDAQDVIEATAARPPSQREAPPGPARTTTSDTAFSDQSICEVCGSLTRDLARYNGQLVCADCRDV